MKSRTRATFPSEAMPGLGGVQYSKMGFWRLTPSWKRRLVSKRPSYTRSVVICAAHDCRLVVQLCVVNLAVTKESGKSARARREEHSADRVANAAIIGKTTANWRSNVGS